MAAIPALRTKEREAASPEDCKKLCLERGLPRELLLQQCINGVKGLIECFHCGGRGRVQPGRPGRHTNGQAEMVKEIFKKMDLNGDGVISHNELTECLTAVANASFTEGEVHELIRGFDHNADGNINFEEFVDWIFIPGPRQQTLRTKLCHALLPKVCWLYQEGHGSWAVFDKGMAMTLDAAYREGVGAAVQVHGPAFSYIVDLDSMTQTNLKTGKERRVMRIGVGAESGDEDLANMFLQPQAKWFCVLGRNKQRYEEAVENALEATWASFEKGDADSPEIQMRLNGQVYIFDVEQMQQTNVKSGKSRRISRDLAEADRDEGDPVLMRCPSNIALPQGSCWVCRGSGRTSQWLEPIDGAEQYDGLGPDEGDLPDCLVCYADVASYGISTSCEHRFCLECIRMSLEAIMDVGQFPAFCPMCRAESMGRDMENGRIDGPSLTFLQQRGVVTQAFQHRLLKQQSKALGLEEVEAFECPGRCGEFLLTEDASYTPNKIGQLYDDAASGKVCTRYGSCPVCETNVCIRCQGSVARAADGSAPAHQCRDLADGGDDAEPDEESLALMAKIGKKCPVCAQFIEKNEGCDMMICGTRAHGDLAEVLRNGGCGIPFMWSNLAFCDDSWTDLDGTGKRGRPVTANQLKGRGHPKCARPECNYFKSVDECGPELPWHNGNKGAQGKNNGGDYCCDKCRDDGTHSVLCHKIRWRA